MLRCPNSPKIVIKYCRFQLSDSLRNGRHHLTTNATNNQKSNDLCCFFYKSALPVLLSISLASLSPVYAQDIGEARAPVTKVPRTIQALEYEASSIPGEVLLSVSILGAVGRPGVYRIPKLTELQRLLALAGGPLEVAQLDSVTIKRTVDDHPLIIHVDLKKELSEPSETRFQLQSDDIIMVPAKEPLISSNTLAFFGVISTILTIIASAIIISKNN